MVAVQLAACGGDDGVRHDGGPVPDDSATPDTPPGDTTAPTATVTPAAPGPLRPDTAIVIRFSESIDMATLALGGGLGAGVATTSWSQTSAANDTVTVTGTWPNGDTTLTIDARDPAGNAMTRMNVNYVVDSVSPTVTSTTPAQNATVGPQQTVVFRFSESMKPTSLAALGGTLASSVSGLAWSQTAAADDTLTVTTAAWAGGAGGTLIVPATASDVAGNLLGGAGFTLTIDIDAQGPAVTLTNGPMNNATTNTTAFTIDVGSPASDATSYSYTLSGPSTASGTDVSLATDLQLSGLVDGTYTLTVTAKDAVGNVGVPTMVMFTIDTQGPPVSLVNGPAAGATTNTTSYTIDVSSIASDAASYSYSLTGPAPSSGNNLAFSTDISLSSLTSGSYTLTVTGKDTLGNSGTPTVVSFNVDLDGPPVLLSGAPSNGATTGTRSFTIDVNSSAGDAASYSYTLTGPSPASGNTIGFATDIVLTNLDGGTYTLTVTGTDTLGNPGPPTTVSFTIDTVGPILAANPADGAALDWSKPIVITANEPLSATLADHTASGTITTGITFTKSVSGTTLTLTPSPRWVSDSGKTLQIVARDAFGNPSSTLNLTYDVRDGGVYVHVSGNDANPGTRSEPLKTIGAGLSTVASAYVAADHAEVRVAAGSYNEAITLPAGVRLLGGYSASDWAVAPSRTAFVTTVRDLSTPAASELATVTMGDDTRIERFHVGSSVNATTRCIALQARIATTSPIVIHDNDILSNDCPTVAAYGVLLSKGTIQLSNNKIRSSDKPATNFPASRALYAVRDSATPLNVSIDGDDIATGWAQNGHSRAVEFFGATFTARNATVRAGQGNNPLAFLVTSSAPSRIEGCTIYGGKAQSTSSAIGIHATPTGTLSIVGNVIHGGEPVQSGGVPYGIAVGSGTVLIANNLITGGGTPGETGGGARGILAGAATSIQIFNNTIHAGFRPFSIAVEIGGNNVARLENNIFFFKGATPSGFAGLVVEQNATTQPQTMKNNVFFNADGAANVFGYLDYNSPNGNCPQNGIWNCTPMVAANLDNEVETNDSADATSASGNLVANPLFTSIDGGDGSFTFFAAGTNQFANDWSLQAGSTIKASGLDGAATFGFTTDFTGAPRTGTGTTGWSPGAYERD